MCCLIWLHVDILTLFKRLLTNEEMPMQKVIMEKCLLYLTYGNNHDGVILILCMVFFLFLFFLGFIDHKLYKFV
jgi:hypothetical protein